MVRFLLDNEPALFTKVASYWLNLAYQYSDSKSLGNSRYAAILEFVLTTFNANVNIALFNIDAFTNWLSFLKTLPNLQIMQPVLHHHIEEVLRSIKGH